MVSSSQATLLDSVAPNAVLWIHRAIEGLWLLTVILVPLAFLGREFGELSSVIGSFELPKIALLRTFVGLMVALWLIEWGLQGLITRSSVSVDVFLSLRPNAVIAGLSSWLRASPTRWLTLAAACFLGTTLLSTVLSASIEMSLWGEVPGQDSYSTYTTVAYVFLFAVIVTHLKTASQLWRLLGAIVVMGVLVAGYAILQHYGHDILDLMVPPNAVRATSTVSNPILVGAILLMTISISVVGATITLQGSMRSAGFWWKLGLWGPVLTVQLLGLLFTYSRGPWVGTAAAVVALVGLLAALGHWRLLLRAGLTLALAVAIAAAVVNFPTNSGEEESGGGTPGGGEVTEVITSIGSQLPGIGGSAGAKGLSGRAEIWRESWGLMVDHPWFEFDNLSLSFLRPLVGYGPELFHTTYLLVSPPGFNKLPSEFTHAHNYFVHQGVELGFLGMFASLAVYGALFLVGGYQLFWRSSSYSLVHKLLIIGVLATVAGRTFEQMVGIARVSDLTLFWVLLGVFVALPAIMSGPQSIPEAQPPRRARRRSNRSSSNTTPGVRTNQWRFLGQVVLIGFLVVGIGVVTWTKTINYVRAAIAADSAAAHFRAGDLPMSFSSLERSIDLAPEVSSYYDFKSILYSTYIQYQLLHQHPRCGGMAEIRSSNICLAEEEYLDNVAWAENRPLSFRSKIALATAALNLARLKNDAELARESINLHREAAELVPTSYRAWNRLADVYIVLGQPQEALEALEISLTLLGGHSESSATLLLQAEAYEKLGQIQNELESLDRALQANPKAAGIYFIRGSTYRLLGQPEKAVDDLSRAINLNPKYGLAYFSRVLAYFQLARDSEAEQDVELALRFGVDQSTLAAAVDELKQSRAGGP